MPVEVKVTAVFQRLVGGARSLAVDGKTVGEVLDNLDRKHPGFKARLLNPDGTLQQFVNIYVNDEDIRFMKKLDTLLETGDIVSILPALAGGTITVSSPLIARCKHSVTLSEGLPVGPTAGPPMPSGSLGRAIGPSGRAQRRVSLPHPKFFAPLRMTFWAKPLPRERGTQGVKVEVG